MSSAHAITSSPPFSDIANKARAKHGNMRVELDSIPKNQFKKYDDNPNWAMTLGGEIIIQHNGIFQKRMTWVVFSLIGKNGKVLKTEEHLCEMAQVSQADIDRINRQIDWAQREVDAGRGDEIPDQQWWDATKNSA